MQPGLDSARMALAFVNSGKFLPSTIVGATGMDQLNTNSESVNIILSDDVVQGIQAFHKAQPNPSS